MKLICTNYGSYEFLNELMINNLKFKKISTTFEVEDCPKIRMAIKITIEKRGENSIKIIEN